MRENSRIKQDFIIINSTPQQMEETEHAAHDQAAPT